MIGKLSGRDALRLLEEPTVENKSTTMAHISSLLAQDDTALKPRERALAEDILRVFARDAEQRVREALSAQLCANPRLPREIAILLANDLDSVALPIIEFSSALSDADLLDIVRSSGEGKQKAVARRPSLSEAIAGALVDTGNEAVVAMLMENDAVELSEGVLSRALDAFPTAERVHKPMVHRGSLPVAISERLVAVVAEHLQTHLATHHGMSVDLAADIVQRTRERATMGLISSDQDAVDLVEQLHANGRLTDSIIIRALCVGDSTFFEAALARRAQIPLVNARVLIHDSGRLGLKALCQRTGLADAAFEIVCGGIELMSEMVYDGRTGDRERYKRRMVERLLTRFEHQEGADLDYLLARIDHFVEATQSVGEERRASAG